MSYTVFIDLHGVLVNTAQMIQNYKLVLSEIYSFYKLDKKSDFFHEEGLNLFSKNIEDIKREKISGSAFLTLMENADSKWDDLMQNFIPKSQRKKSVKYKELESRKIEYVAGSLKNTFYPDAILAIQELSSTKEFEIFICSNAHSSHIKGVCKSAGIFNFVSESKIIGWDQTQSLKNVIEYFEYLLNVSANENRVMIGNSDSEMNLSKSIGFKTILVNREYSGDLTRSKVVDLKLENLSNISESISSLF